MEVDLVYFMEVDSMKSSPSSIMNFNNFELLVVALMTLEFAGFIQKLISLYCSKEHFMLTKSDQFTFKLTLEEPNWLCCYLKLHSFTLLSQVTHE